MKKYISPWDRPLLVVHPQQGRRTLGDGSGGRSGGITYGDKNGVGKVAMWPKGLHPGYFVRPDHLVPLDVFARKTLRRIEKLHDVKMWYAAFGFLFHLPDDHPLASKRKKTLSLCLSSSGADGLCGRPIYDERPLCNMHASHAARRDTRQEQEKQAKVERDENEDRRRKLERDLIEMWNVVCDERDIVRRNSNRIHVTNNGQAYVDNEVLMLLLRELAG